MPAQSTYTPIATFNGTGATEVLSFNSIPQTYTDLVVVANLMTTVVSGSQTITMSFNTGTGAVYSGTVLQGNGSTAISNRQSATTVFYPITPSIQMSTTNPTLLIMNISNYANTTTFKSVLSRISSDKNGSGITTGYAGLFASTAAINSVTFSSNQTGNHWATNSTFTLYGIAAA
jgi:hypothetical protein